MQTLVITPAPQHGADQIGQADTHHGLVMKGVHSVWAAWGQQMLDLAILTGSLDLKHQDSNGMREASTAAAGGRASTPEDGAPVVDARLMFPGRVEALVADFDLVFFLLSESLLSALSLPLDVPEKLQQIYLTSQDSLGMVAEGPGVQAIVADGPVAARRWHVKADRVRGFLFGRLCGQMVEHGPTLLEWLHRRPQDTESLFYKRARWRPQWPLWDE